MQREKAPKSGPVWRLDVKTRRPDEQASTFAKAHPGSWLNCAERTKLFGNLSGEAKHKSANFFLTQIVLVWRSNRLRKHLA
jgi:hypothetical protein